MPTKTFYWLASGLVVGFLVVGGVVILGTGQQATPEADSDRLVVAATIFPLADIVAAVGGERVDVVQLVPTGASPHHYALTPDQVAAAQKAQAVFMIGHGLDNYLVEALERSGSVMAVVVDEGIELKTFGELHEEDHEDEEHGSLDPHYWLTVPNGQAIARTVGRRLQQIDPEHQAYYQERLAIYEQDLVELEQELQRLASQTEQRHFIAMHDAWQYLADHYGFELVGTYEPVEGRQPSLEDLRELQHLVAQYDLSVFYVEPQKQSAGSVRFIERELDLDIAVLDPEGGASSVHSYLDMMRHNVGVLVNPSL